MHSPLWVTGPDMNTGECHVVSLPCWFDLFKALYSETHKEHVEIYNEDDK